MSHSKKKTRYQALIGTLSFISLGSRPDVTYTTNLLARFQQNPTQQTIELAERALQYLDCTIAQSIPLKPQHLDGKYKLTLIVDASWDTLPESRSTHGYIIYLNQVPIIWKSKAQTTVALSATEAEYIGLCSGVKELFALFYTLQDWNIHVDTPMDIFCDNEGAVQIGRNRTSNKRVRHLERQYFYVQDHYNNKKIDLRYINTNDNIADLLTKALGKLKLEVFRRKLLDEVKEGVGINTNNE